MVVILIMVLMKGEIDWVPICSFEVHLYDYYQNPTHMKVLSAFLWSLNHHSKATIRQKVHSAKKKKRTQKVHNIKPFILVELKAHCATVQVLVLVLVLCMRGYTLVLSFIARAADAYSLSVALDLTIYKFLFHNHRGSLMAVGLNAEPFLMIKASW